MSIGRVGLSFFTLIVCLTLVGHTLLSPNGWRRRSRLAQDLLTLTRENDALEERSAHLRQQIQSLKQRPEAQEHAVRDELGWVRPGDLVIHFGPAP